MSPRTNLLLGQREWLLQRPSNAFTYWQKSLTAAQQFGMPYDQALAHYEIGRHEANPLVQEKHIQNARQLFDKMGIPFDLRS
jgi:hypothetical protein